MPLSANLFYVRQSPPSWYFPEFCIVKKILWEIGGVVSSVDVWGLAVHKMGWSKLARDLSRVRKASYSKTNTTRKNTFWYSENRTKALLQFVFGNALPFLRLARTSAMLQGWELHRCVGVPFWLRVSTMLKKYTFVSFSSILWAMWASEALDC